MTTMEVNARDKFDPQTILDEIREDRRRREIRESRIRRARYQICPEANSLTIFLYGIGFLIFVVGLCTSLLTVPLAFLGWMATWVVAAAVRSYFCRVVYPDQGDY